MRVFLIAAGAIGLGFVALLMFALVVGASAAEDAFNFAYGNDEKGVTTQDKADDVVQNVEHDK